MKDARRVRSPLRYPDENGGQVLFVIKKFSRTAENPAGICSDTPFGLRCPSSVGTLQECALSPHHLCTPSLPPPSCSSNCRIPNSGLALPYREVKTSPAQTTETPLWWCQTCCQMDPPWDGSCKSMMLFSIDIYGFTWMVGNRYVWLGA